MVALGLPVFIAATILSLPSAHADEDTRGIAHRGRGLKVIEEKCLVCHNRQRIDEAIRERRDMEKIIRMMEHKGVAITEKERKVMGHFWQQSPFREKKGDQPQKDPGGSGIR